MADGTVFHKDSCAGGNRNLGEIVACITLINELLDFLVERREAFGELGEAIIEVENLGGGETFLYFAFHDEAGGGFLLGNRAEQSFGPIWRAGESHGEANLETFGSVAQG